MSRVLADDGREQGWAEEGREPLPQSRWTGRMMRTFERARIFLRLRFKRRTWEARERARVRTRGSVRGHEDQRAAEGKETYALLAPLVTHTAGVGSKERQCTGQRMLRARRRGEAR